MIIRLNNCNALSGTIEIPADKSITHRAIILSCLASGNSIVRNYLSSDDCNKTIAAFIKLGVDIKINKGDLYIRGVGLKIPACNNNKYEFYAGNSGTTARLLAGVFAGQNFSSVITGDQSLSKRPMDRVQMPLLQMGANISLNKNLLPMRIKSVHQLRAVNYISNNFSAQVKSAILFAGLYADETTTYTETIKSRDHSERMLKLFGADIKVNNNSVTIYPVKKIFPREIVVPGDLSSAAFFIAAALIVPGSNIIIKNIGVNSTRNGLIGVLEQMGSDIRLTNFRDISNEPVCDINVRYSKLKSVHIASDMISSMIDEVPVFVLIATQAEGVTRIEGAGELKVKESNRIFAITSQLRKMGAQVEALEDGFIINGSNNSCLTGTLLNSFKDHRIAMTLAVASLIAKGETYIKDFSCVSTSFPKFYEVLKSVCK